MSDPVPPLAPDTLTPTKSSLGRKILTIGLLTVVALKGYVVYQNFTHKSPELRFAHAVDENPALKKALLSALAQGVAPMVTEAGCLPLSAAHHLYAARSAKLSVTATSQKLSAHLKDVLAQEMHRALQNDPLVAQEAASVSADLMKFSRILTAAAMKQAAQEDPESMQVWAKDGLLEAAMLSEAQYKAAEMQACVLDARVAAQARDLHSAMSDAYTAMRTMSYSAVLRESDLFAKMPAKDLPKLAAGVLRWQSAGDFVLLAELPVSEAALCDQINATSAAPLPAWALPESGAPAPGSTRWSCSKYADKIVVRHDGSLLSLVPGK